MSIALFVCFVWLSNFLFILSCFGFGLFLEFSLFLGCRFWRNFYSKINHFRMVCWVTSQICCSSVRRASGRRFCGSAALIVGAQSRICCSQIWAMYLCMYVESVLQLFWLSVVCREISPTSFTMTMLVRTQLLTTPSTAWKSSILFWSATQAVVVSVQSTSC